MKSHEDKPRKLAEDKTHEAGPMTEWVPRNLHISIALGGFPSLIRKCWEDKKKISSCTERSRNLQYIYSLQTRWPPQTVTLATGLKTSLACQTYPC